VLELDLAVIRAETIEPWLKTRPGLGSDGLTNKPLADVEKHVTLTTLERFKGHRMKTAHALGIGVRTLGMKLKKWKDEGELVEAGA
jgi:two-component system, NtrC family, response regulator HydG